jgi:hypothetical protein
MAGDVMCLDRKEQSRVNNKFVYLCGIMNVTRKLLESSDVDDDDDQDEDVV